MSIFKRFLSQITSNSSGSASIADIAKDVFKSQDERGRDIARAFNRAGGSDAYFKFREEQMHNLDQHFSNSGNVEVALKNLWEQRAKHTREVKELAQSGDEPLLKNAPRLQAAAADINLRWSETHQLLDTTITATERLKITFEVLAKAETYMHQLPQSEKGFGAQGMNALRKLETDFRQHWGNMPPVTKEAEIAITHARNAEIERANQQREAIVAAEAAGHRIKFNEYLNTGLSTGTAIKAPGTARFTRKTKSVQGVYT